MKSTERKNTAVKIEPDYYAIYESDAKNRRGTIKGEINLALERDLKRRGKITEAK